jgi:hypothetical protein
LDIRHAQNWLVLLPVLSVKLGVQSIARTIVHVTFRTPAGLFPMVAIEPVCGIFIMYQPQQSGSGVPYVNMFIGSNPSNRQGIIETLNMLL